MVFCKDQQWDIALIWFILMTDLMLELILIWVIILKNTMQMIFTDFETVINTALKNMNGFLLICFL